MFELLVLLIFPAAMVFAALSDLVTMTISNWISIGLAASFVVLGLWAGLDLAVIGSHLLIGLIALALGFGCFAMKWIGGGDAKLFAATSIWLGWAGFSEYALFAAFLGGILTIALVLMRPLPLPARLTRHRWIDRLHKLEDGIPYGVALGAAGLIVYPKTILLAATG